MTFLLNSAVMPQPGTYTLERLTAQQFAAEVQAAAAAPELVSHIGYNQPAAHIFGLTRVDPPIDRSPCFPHDGDVLLICRLPYRVADPATKGQPQPQDWEYLRAKYQAPEPGDPA